MVPIINGYMDMGYNTLMDRSVWFNRWHRAESHARLYPTNENIWRRGCYWWIFLLASRIEAQ